MKIYEGISQREEFISENPTITIEQAQEILNHHNYHNHRSVRFYNDNNSSSYRALIYESTKDNIEIIAKAEHSQFPHPFYIVTKDVFNWMGH